MFKTKCHQQGGIKMQYFVDIEFTWLVIEFTYYGSQVYINVKSINLNKNYAVISFFYD